DRVHEMIIVLHRDTFIRPHRHLNKAESLHVVHGAAQAVFFTEAGKIADVVPMGDYSTGRCFYYRVNGPDYHTLIIESEMFIFHETTHGPLNRSETEFAAWSPAEGDRAAVSNYLTELRNQLTAFTARRK